MDEDVACAEARRLAAELVLGDEALTADLADPEAEILLRWAGAEAQRTAVACTGAGPVDREQVALAVRPVRKLTRAISELVATHQELDEQAFLQRLLELIELAGQCVIRDP